MLNCQPARSAEKAFAELNDEKTEAMKQINALNLDLSKVSLQKGLAASRLPESWQSMASRVTDRNKLIKIDRPEGGKKKPTAREVIAWREVIARLANCDLQRARKKNQEAWKKQQEEAWRKEQAERNTVEELTTGTDSEEEAAGTGEAAGRGEADARTLEQDFFARTRRQRKKKKLKRREKLKEREAAAAAADNPVPDPADIRPSSGAMKSSGLASRGSKKTVHQQAAKMGYG